MLKDGEQQQPAILTEADKIKQQILAQNEKLEDQKKFLQSVVAQKTVGIKKISNVNDLLNERP